MASTLYNSWNHSWLGTATINWTDDAGAHAVSMTSADNGGRYCLRDLSSVGYDSKLQSGSLDLEIHAFITDLVTKMDAATTETITGSFSTTTLAHTLASTGSVFSITFSGSAGLLMRRILGYTADRTGATSYVSNMRPWFVWRAAIDGRTNYDQPAMRDGEIQVRRASNAAYAIGPIRPVYSTRFEHHHEALEDVQSRWADSTSTVGGASWAFQNFAETAALYAGPVIAQSSTETQVGYCMRGFTKEAYSRSRKDYDGNQIVRVELDPIVGYL